MKASVTVSDLVLPWCLGNEAASLTSQNKLQMFEGWFCLHFACADVEFPPPVSSEPLGSKIKTASLPDVADTNCSVDPQALPLLPLGKTALSFFQPSGSL